MSQKLRILSCNNYLMFIHSTKTYFLLNLFVYLSICLCLSAYMYVYLFVYVLLVNLFVYLSVFVYLHMSVSFCLPVLLIIYFSVCILSYVFLSVLSACLSIFALLLITNDKTLKQMWYLLEMVRNMRILQTRNILHWHTSLKS